MNNLEYIFSNLPSPEAIKGISISKKINQKQCYMKNFELEISIKINFRITPKFHLVQRVIPSDHGSCHHEEDHRRG